MKTLYVVMNDIIGENWGTERGYRYNLHSEWRLSLVIPKYAFEIDTNVIDI